jgi:cysteinyl-tRNA synthetase
MVMAVEKLKARHAELVSASMSPSAPTEPDAGWTLKQVQGDEFDTWVDLIANFDGAMSEDLSTPLALTSLEDVLGRKKVPPSQTLEVVSAMDTVLGLDLMGLTRADLRIRPKAATITEAEIEAALDRRKEARAARDFAASDAIRDKLAAAGVEVMDGDPLGWEWKLA